MVLPDWVEAAYFQSWLLVGRRPIFSNTWSVKTISSRRFDLTRDQFQTFRSKVTASVGLLLSVTSFVLIVFVSTNMLFSSFSQFQDNAV